MPTVEDAIVARVLAIAAVAADVGNRVVPEMGDERDQFPAIVYRETSGDKSTNMAGRHKLVKSNVTLECWAATYDKAKSIRSLILTDFKTFKGVIAGVTVRAVFPGEDADDLEAELNNRERVYAAAMSIAIWYLE